MPAAHLKGVECRIGKDQKRLEWHATATALEKDKHTHVYISHRVVSSKLILKPPLMILSLKAVQCSPVPAPVEYKKKRFYATTLIEIATKTGEATLDIFTLGNLFLIAIDNYPHTAHQPSTMSGDSVHPANDM